MGVVDPGEEQDKNSSAFSRAWDFFSFSKDRGKWQGRVYLLPDPNDSDAYFAYKFARRSEASANNLRVEQERILQAANFGIKNVPELISGVAPLQDVIGKLPKDLDPEFVLVSKTKKDSRQYLTWKYTDIEPAKRPFWLRSYALKSISDLCIWIKNSYIHTSLSPLTHSDVFEETWFWNVDPVGEVQDLKESLRHTNMRRTGLDDFEHIRKIDQNLNLEFAIGQAYVEWMITSTYAGFINGIPINNSSKVGLTLEQILIDGHSEFLKDLGAENNTAVITPVIRKYLQRYSLEWLKNNLAAPSAKEPQTSLSYLLELTKHFLEQVETSEIYRNIKKSWLENTNDLRNDEIISADSGSIFRKSWADSKIQILTPDGKVIKELNLQSPPRSIATDNAGRLFLVMDGRLLVYNHALKLEQELLGDYLPVMSVSADGIVLVNSAGYLEIRDSKLSLLKQVHCLSNDFNLMSIFTITKQGQLYLLDAERQRIQVFDIGANDFIRNIDTTYRVTALATDLKDQILVGGDRKLAIFSKEGACLKSSEQVEHVTSISLTSSGQILAADKHNHQMLVYDAELNLESKISSYGNEHKILVYSKNMELLGEIKGFHNPFRILESKCFKLILVKKTKNMCLVQYDPNF